MIGYMRNSRNKKCCKRSTHGFCLYRQCEGVKCDVDEIGRKDE